MRHIRLNLVAGVLAAACALAARADAYPRQEGVDAQHYAFSLTLSDASDEFVGHASATMLFTKDGIRQISFDLMSAANGRGMTVSAVKIANVPAIAPAATAPAAGGDVRDAVFTHENSKLVVKLPDAPKAGDKLQLLIDYRGVPGPGMHIGANRNGERCFFSENWPDRARQWLPCIDHPYDKATSEFIITAPSKYQVVANGVLVDVVKNADGTNTTHWRESVPNATWLNAIGVANFAEHDGDAVRGIPLQTWVFPQQANFTPAMEKASTQALNFYMDYVGPYPWEKLANVQAAGIGGGTEHSSAIFYGQTSLNVSGPPSLLYHEIAHQWFGCSVTEKDWDDVWLSEAFATYFALLCTEKYEGHEAFIAGVKRSRDTVLATERRMPTEAVIHNNLADMRGVLNQLVYQKGCWFLHMLRGRIGDEAFQTGIRAYYKKYRNGSASTEDLRAEMEAASGTKLDWFFAQWLKRPGSPYVEGTWTYDAAGKKIVMDLAQSQSAETFRLPLEIGVSAGAAAGGAATGPATTNATPATNAAGNGTLTVMKIEMTEKKQHFELPCETEPGSVVLDPNTWVLMTSKFGKL